MTPTRCQAPKSASRGETSASEEPLAGFWTHFDGTRARHPSPMRDLMRDGVIRASTPRRAKDDPKHVGASRLG
jgi:hypothetical protein